MQSSENSSILLESGTNELEIVMFQVGDGIFGINVLKVREIINPLPLTETPNDHEYIEGVIELRGEVMPVINVAKVLQVDEEDILQEKSEHKFIVTEFNQLKVAFHVHSVSEIHRLSWEEIEKPSELHGGIGHTIGIIKMDTFMCLLLDFEKIVTAINPEANINKKAITKMGKRERSLKKIVVVEDSAMLRNLLEETLSEAGYERVTFFENGKEAWDYFENLSASGENIKQHVDLIITDIEMPQMDGHHLTRRLKEDDYLKEIPVIIFSSLISEQLKHKGKQVGADSQISKPEIATLILKMDAYLA